MTSYTRAKQLAAALSEVLRPCGVRVVCDPRSANPPVGVLGIPALSGDVHGGFTASWRLEVTLPGSRWDADAWAKADDIIRLLEPALPIESVVPDTTSDYLTLTIAFEEALT